MAYTEDKRVHELNQISSGYSDSDRIPYQDTDALDELKYVTVGDLADYITENATNIGGTNVTDIDPVVDPTATSAPTGLAASNKTVYFSPAVSGGWGAQVQLDWDANSEDNFSHYVVRWKVSSDSVYSYYVVYTNSMVINGLIPGEEYHFGVCSVNKAGFQSSFSSDITETMETDSTAPSAPSNVSAAGGPGYAVIDWDDNTEADLAYYKIYQNTVDDFASSTLTGTSGTNYFIDSNDGNGYMAAATWYWWVTAVDTSGNESDESDSASAAVTGITDAHVTSLSASKILIDGVVYLSNWRKTGDLTKIDGGSISAKTVTATQISVANLQALSANMGSLTAGSIVVTTGSDNIWLNDSSDGCLHVGGGTKATAPFRVSADGTFVATNGTVTGTFQTLSGTTQRIVVQSSDNTFRFYDDDNHNVVTIDDDSDGAIKVGYDTYNISYVGNGLIQIKTGLTTSSDNILQIVNTVGGAGTVLTLNADGSGDFSGAVNCVGIVSSGDIYSDGYGRFMDGIKVDETIIVTDGRILQNVTLPSHSASLVTSGTMSKERISGGAADGVAYYNTGTGILDRYASLTLTKMGYLATITSDVQAQINAKLATSTYTSHAASTTAHISGLSSFAYPATKVVGYTATFGWGLYNA